MKRWTHSAFVILVLAGIAACGGGSGSDAGDTKTKFLITMEVL